MIPQNTLQSAAVLQLVQKHLASAAFELTTAHQKEGEGERQALQGQLSDYVLPRVASLDAPLLAVVGGSTGAGKSTLVNALIGYPVTRAGAIRPTTRQPLLLHHPDDAAWFEDSRILPQMSRVRGQKADPNTPLSATEVGQNPDAALIETLTLVATDSVPQGLALLDAPDIDSVSDENRKLAKQLLAAADLWIFVTTANRYADAVPWQVLKDAAERDITLAVVLDRVPAGVVGEIEPDLRSLLSRQGLSHAELFVIEEAQMDERRMLPAGTADELNAWIHRLAADASTRSAIAKKSLDGVLKQYASRLQHLSQNVREQEDAAAHLASISSSNYGAAVEDVLAGIQDGQLLRGEVLARWQDFVGTGEFFRSLESGIGRLRDRVGAMLTGKPAPAVQVETAIETGLHAVIVNAAARAAERTEIAWLNDAAGRALASGKNLGSNSPGFDEAVAGQIRAWQADVLETIRTEGMNKRRTARLASFGVNAAAVSLMVVIFASTAGLTGAEIGIAGGTAVLSQKLLESIFGEDAVRRLAKMAKQRLLERVEALMRGESERFTDQLPLSAPEGTEPLSELLAADASALSRGLVTAETTVSSAVARQNTAAQDEPAPNHTPEGRA